MPATAYELNVYASIFMAVKMLAVAPSSKWSLFGAYKHTLDGWASGGSSVQRPGKSNCRQHDTLLSQKGAANENTNTSNISQLDHQKIISS